MHYLFGDGREVESLDESVLPVTKKEGKREGKNDIGLGIKVNCTHRDVMTASFYRGSKY